MNNKKRLIVRGPVLSQSGYGEQARFALRALRSREDIFDIFIIPTGWGHTGWVARDSDERHWIDQNIKRTAHMLEDAKKRNLPLPSLFDMSLQITIPNEWENMAPINIGYTAGIETTKVSPAWLQKANLMDRIVVVSNHAKNVFESSVYTSKQRLEHLDEKHPQNPPESVSLKCTTPIGVANYSVRKEEPSSLDLALEYDFNFLCVAQFGPRKNLENTIKWFVEENFDQEVGLVVKTSIKNNCIIDREYTENKVRHILNNFEDHKCKVYLLHGDMTDGEMAALYTHPKIKAIVTTTHGEGFGLPLFEAACHAMPVVASGWSGQCDFLYMPDTRRKTSGKKRPMFASVEYDLAPVQPEAVWDTVIQADSNWCYPREASFKRRLREVYTKYSQFKKNANKLQKWILKEFTPEKRHEEFIIHMFGKENYDYLTTSIEVKELPKISIITSVFDAADFIDGFMVDITNQTIFEEKCEWVIINANPPGKDYEEEVILKYVEKYPNNIVYQRLEKDPGIYEVWNEAIQMSTGEYIVNANCDDRKRFDNLEVLAKYLYAHDDVAVAYGQNFITRVKNETFDDNSSNNNIFTFIAHQKQQTLYPKMDKQSLMMEGNLPHCMPMWRKSLHDKYGLFNTSYKSSSDWEFWLRCLFEDEKIHDVKEVLGLYYINPEGLSTAAQSGNNRWRDQETVEIRRHYGLKLGYDIAPYLANSPAIPAATF